MAEAGMFPDEVAQALIPLERARGVLGTTEPIETVTFWTGDPRVQVTYGDGWWEGAKTEPAGVHLYVPGRGWHQLTFEAAEDLGSTCRANQKYQVFLPPAILQDAVNWALAEGLGERELMLMTAGTGTGPDGTSEVPLGVAQTRATIAPFSNLELLDAILGAARETFGEQAAEGAVTDLKLWHTLEHTSLRVLLPAVQHVIAGTGDTWCYGIELHNSLAGDKQTVVSGYVCQLATGAGATDIERSAGGFKRRGSKPGDAYAWAAESAAGALSGAAEAFAAIGELTRHRLPGDFSRPLTQLFRDSAVPRDQRDRVTAILEETPGELSMYHVLTAAARAANMQELGWRPAATLMHLGGHVIGHGGGLCDGTLPNGCRRLLPEDWGSGPEDADPEPGA